MLWLTDTRTRADGLGTVGNWHIGLLARILFVFLLDESTRPKPAAMKTWVDVINWVKREVRSYDASTLADLADAARWQAWGESSSGLTFFTCVSSVSS